MLTVDEAVLEAQLRIQLAAARSALSVRRRFGWFENEQAELDAEDEVLSLDEHLCYVLEQNEAASTRREEAEWAATHTWFDSMVREFDFFKDPISRAKQALWCYLGSFDWSEAYDDFNIDVPVPTGESMLAQIETNRQHMLAALSVLDDDQILSVADRVMHNRMAWPYSVLAEVRSWSNSIIAPLPVH